MSFLQPFILWGLPLILVPVIIHLLNRMRYRTVAWAAMMFLLTASKQATRQARVREWLILAMRILAVLALILFLARPLVGGWLGSAAGGGADTVILLLDRSPSMEAVDPQTRLSKRALALRRLAEASAESGGGSRYVLMDSATRQPQEVSSPAVLADLSVAGPSDAAADIPALLDAALDYLQANRSGRAEIWLCSDLQSANWLPDAPGWGTVRERFKQLGQDIRVRLLALTQPTKDNIGVRVTDVVRRRTGKGYELQITAELTGQDAAAATFPLTVVHEGARSQVEVNFGGQKLTTQCRLDLGPRQSAGWGWVELPADANPRDNQAFFVYPEDLRAKSVIVAESEPAGRLLRLAAAPSPLLLNQVAETQAAGDALKLDDVALLIWQSAAPSGTVEKAVSDFVASGGVVLYLPATTAEDGKFRVATWRNADGPLAKTQDGKDLPLPEVTFSKRTTLSSEGSVLAMFDDSKPFLTKVPYGRGAYYHCASLPVREWSSLWEGTVLVPMVQRLVQEGARRLGSIVDADVGDTRFLRANSLAATDNKGAVSVKATAGVYQQDTKLVALNRPAREDDLERLDEAGVRAAMGTIPYRLFEEKGTGTAALQTEIWRWFLIGMLLFLTGEAIFSLPTGAQTKRWDVPGERVAFGKETPPVNAGGGQL
jgi:hypothetical protein